MALHVLPLDSIEEDMQLHPAWLGSISGLKAEKLLRGKKTPYLYLLREGEHENDYYVTYLLPDLSIRHQPFVITATKEGWSFENGGAGGPFTNSSIDDVIHLIMHCEKHECLPLYQWQ
jgi:hypothetical protein